MNFLRELSLGWLVLLLSTVKAQDQGFNHELPPGVELINPKDLGLSDADLGKFLGNVKVLGGGQVGDTKTQILTVGFDGDENLNLDDFDIPGLTDKKGATNLEDKDKEIANVAFEKFKEFFKDSKKNGKPFEEATQRSLAPLTTPFSATSNQFSTPSLSNAPKLPQPQKQGKESAIKYTQAPKPSAQTLQQQYPVRLTQPVFSTTSRPIQEQYSTFKAPVPTTQGQPTYPPQHHQNHQNQNFNLNQNNQNSIRYQNPQSPTQNPIRYNEFQSQNYITPLLAAQNQLNTHGDQQTYQQNTTPLEFGAKLPSTHAPIHQQPYRDNNQAQYAHQQQQYQNQNPPQLKQHQQQPKIQSTQLPPDANYQRFNLYPPQKQLKQQHREKQSPDYESIGKVVRNQLSFNHNSHSQSQTQTPQSFPNQHHQNHPQLKPQPQQQQQQQQQQQPKVPQKPQQPILSPSSSIPSPTVQRFPQDQQRPVSHVFIQHEKHASPVQQTSFHPRFQAPTNFVNNFTPSALRLTTPAPRIDVTPSMPMILLSTNENAITDPERMERLRQQQRHREEIRIRELQRQSHAINFQKQQNQPEYNQAEQTQQPQTQPPYQQYSTIRNNGQQAPSSEPPREFHQQNPSTPGNNNNYQNNNNNANNNNNNFQHQFQNQQNSFNFQAQQGQQNHLNLAQRQPNFFQAQQSQFYPSFQQPQPQASNNFPQVGIVLQHQQPQGNQEGFPPRFQIRPDPQQFAYSTIRHKRGYRHRLSNLLRGLRWRERD